MATQHTRSSPRSRQTTVETTLHVESASIEPIPPESRHGKPWTLFTLWFGANVQFATLSVGALATAAFGLDLRLAALAVLLGTALSGSLIGLLSVRGARTGIPQLIQTRGPFGFIGNLPAAAITLINGIGWYVVDTLLGIFILRHLFDMGLLTALAIMATAQLVIPLFGYRMIHAFERILAGFLLVVFFLVSIYGFGNATATPAIEPVAGTLGAFILTVSVTSARGLGWAMYSSDYSRYLPSDTSAWRIFGAAAGGSIAAGAWIGTLGAALGTVASVSDPTTLVSSQLPHLLATTTLIFLLGSTLASTVLDLYSGALAALVAGISMPRWSAVVAVSACGIVAAWFAAQNDFVNTFRNFLLLMGYWLGPWTAVTLVAFFGRKRSRPDVSALYDRAHRWGWGLPAVLLGVLAAIPFMDQTLYTGPLASAHPALSGIGHIVGFLVAGLAYLALTVRTARS